MTRLFFSPRNRPHARMTPMMGLLWLTGLLWTTSVQAETSGEGSAERALKAMSDYMASQKTLSVEFEIEIDIITPDIEKIQFSSYGSVVLSRPDKIHFVRKGGNIDLEIVSDGKNLTIIDRANSSYSQIESRGSIEGDIKLLSRVYRIEIPTIDPLLASSYDDLKSGILDGKDIDVAVIDGTECQHLAFRNSDTDWQLWMRTGAHRLPCKYIIASKTVAAAPEYTIRYHNWTSGQAVPATAFTFVPPPAAKLVAFDKLSSTMELPPAAP